MDKIAFIFPGQGSQSVGMGADFYNNSKAAKAVFEKAGEVLGKDIAKMCFEGPEEDLKLTINAQPAILAASIAALEALRERISVEPSYLAGHSLGEYGALYCGGVLDLENVFKAIQKRAELMNAATLKSKGTMAAVLGLTSTAVEECLTSAAVAGVAQIANYNSPEQIVITGDIDSIRLSRDLLTQAGAKRVLPLAVSGAFHSKLMSGAANAFADFVTTLEVNDSACPIVMNVDASSQVKAEAFREKMPKQICSSVYWTQTIEFMINNGVKTFVELGPNKILAGLNKKISPDIVTYNVYDMETLNKTAQSLFSTSIGEKS